jgi:hypothetical protein
MNDLIAWTGRSVTAHATMGPTPVMTWAAALDDPAARAM